MPLLEVDDLAVEFRTRGGTVRALENVGLSVENGEIVGVVGESGSGKSVAAYAVMGILDPAARVTAGRILFDGTNILTTRERQLRDMRGRDMAMIFQNARGALNPIRTVGRQIADVLKRHKVNDRRGIDEQVVAALKAVRIPDPDMRAGAYPYELSGGMCQRVGIALAMACSPRLLIADEPSTGLDVTTQATIMDLMRDLVRADRTAAILITHDLLLAAEHCDRIVVMHAGHVVEAASTAALFATPRHPYTAALIAATPREDTRLAALRPIEGSIPDLRADLPPCRFAERCPRRIERCVNEDLPRTAIGADHVVACWRPL